MQIWEPPQTQIMLRGGPGDIGTTQSGTYAKNNNHNAAMDEFFV